MLKTCILGYSFSTSYTTQSPQITLCGIRRFFSIQHMFSMNNRDPIPKTQYVRENRQSRRKKSSEIV